MKKTLKYVLAATALVTSLGALASCGGGDAVGKGVHTYNTYTMVSPSNWNELTYQDQNDLQIMSYIQSGFFSYDYKFDDAGEPVEGEFEVVYEGATGLEDVTDTYRTNKKWGLPEKGDGFAYKITLREDLKWDDGTPITAEDFVYTMKQQLDPLFKNYRADSFYNGANVLHGAKAYAYQGMQDWFPADTPYTEYKEELDDKLIFSLGNAEENAALQKTDAASTKLTSIRGVFGFPATWDSATVAKWLSKNAVTSLTDAQITSLQGKTFKAIKADPALKEVWDTLTTTLGVGANEELLFFTTHYTFPEASWDNVGIFSKAGDSNLKENELVLVLDKPQALLKEDGSLSFKAAYNMASLPLVKKDLYEANKVKPVEGSTLWTTTYNSSVASTASWGPYKLTSFQSGKEYVLERNPYWFGYGDAMVDGKYDASKNNNLYQADRIVCQTIKEWNTAWLAFQKGDIDSIGIDVSIAQDYKHSSQAIFTPSDFVGSMQLQSSSEALLKRQSKGVNKTILTNKNFRKAISLAVDRKEYNNKCTTSSKPGFGLFNQMHYYDVENGGVYRDTDEAKRALCEAYGVDVSKYPSLDDAYKSITGYDLEQARKLVNLAVEESMKEENGYKEGDKVVLTFGSGADNESVQRIYKFLSDALKEMVKGTKLEGKLETTFENHNEKWADDFRNGAYDICTGGWSGAAWDPGYFLLAYLSPDYMYSQAWKTDEQMLKLTVPGVGKDGADVTETMSLMDWYNCLNGDPEAKYNWAEGKAPVKARLAIISALEQEILSMYYTVPLQNGYSAELISFKTEYITRDYNTFMGYGGVKYLQFNYDDAEWAKYTKDHKLDYKA